MLCVEKNTTKRHKTHNARKCQRHVGVLLFNPSSRKSIFSLPLPSDNKTNSQAGVSKLFHTDALLAF